LNGLGAGGGMGRRRDGQKVKGLAWTVVVKYHNEMVLTRLRPAMQGSNPCPAPKLDNA
jgi:hypothetical protein